jgi:predicted nucleic-acid-binding protein
MIGLDTNVLVRYLAQDDREQSRQATKLVEGTLTAEDPGWVSLIVLVEVVWVMESCYDATRQEVAALLETMLRVKQLRFQEADAAWQALRVFRAGKGDFADCLIERVGYLHGCDRTLTFDRAAAGGAGMALLK